MTTYKNAAGTLITPDPESEALYADAPGWERVAQKPAAKPRKAKPAPELEVDTDG